MEKILLNEIASKYIVIYIFDYIKDENFIFKLFKFSKFFQKKCDLKLYDYKEKYICLKLIKYISKKNKEGKKVNTLFDLLEKEFISEFLSSSNRYLKNFESNGFEELKKKNEDEKEIEWSEKFWKHYKKKILVL